MSKPFGRKIAPIIARAELEQARFIVSTLSTRASAAVADLRKPPARAPTPRDRRARDAEW
jgi:hypothetical protein